MYQDWIQGITKQLLDFVRFEIRQEPKNLHGIDRGGDAVIVLDILYQTRQNGLPEVVLDGNILERLAVVNVDVA